MAVISTMPNVIVGKTVAELVQNRFFTPVFGGQTQLLL